MVYKSTLSTFRAEKDQELFFQLQDMMTGGPECTKCIPEVAVTNLTPIMAAAIKGNVEITRILLERGFYIKKPHSPKCMYFKMYLRNALKKIKRHISETESV